MAMNANGENIRIKWTRIGKDGNPRYTKKNHNTNDLKYIR